MDNHNWGIIINPVAGGGFALSYSKTIEKMFIKNGIKADMTFTSCPGHASDLANEFALEGYKTIIVAGGDGTFNEAVQGLVDKTDIAIGVIPAGTGNDFIPSLGFNCKFTDYDWKVFFERNTIFLDAGICNGRYFINGVGVGFDAQVALEVIKSREDPRFFLFRNGKFNYTWHILKNLFFYKSRRMHFFSRGSWREGSCFLTTIGNGRSFGGGYFLTPEACTNDGLLDVCLVQEVPIYSRVKELLAVKRGMHIYDKVVDYFRVKKLTLEFEKDVPFHMDGEILYQQNISVNIRPKALKFIYNPYIKNYLKPAELKTHF